MKDKTVDILKEQTISIKSSNSDCALIPFNDFMKLKMRKNKTK